MPNLALRGIPDGTYAALRRAAQRNHRSLNGEILARLQASLEEPAADPDVILARARQRATRMGPTPVDEPLIQRLKAEGRD